MAEVGKNYVTDAGDQTYEGMAHLAGGTPGFTCAECKFATGKKYRHIDRSMRVQAHNTTCLKFVEQINHIKKKKSGARYGGKRFLSNAKACKYFKQDMSE